MNNLDSWMPNNEEYLAKALAWLRWRLRKFAQLSDTEIAEVTEKPTTEGMNPLPALILLSQKLGLSDFEQEILLLCVAMELDPGMARLCARAFDNAHQPYPTFALALSLFDEPAWDALSWERPLRYWRLIEIHQLGVQPLTSSGLRVDERVLNYIKGLNSLGDRAIFNPTFGKAIVVVRPGILTGTGRATVNKKTICIDGDEKKVLVPGCSYISPPNVTPGTGILSIQSLAVNQRARKVKSRRKAVLLKGSTFTAKFQVILPAQVPPTPVSPPIPDPIRIYIGTKFFTTTNMKVKGT